MLKSLFDGLIGLGPKFVNLCRWFKSLLGPSPGWTGLQRWLAQIATLVMLAGGSGVLVATLGLVPIRASSGHWPITAWFLSFTMRQSVATQSIGISTPSLDDPGMVLQGATHYQTGCFPCHGTPAIKQPRIASHMTPHPPYLPPEIHKWKPQELFYIVKHGVKFTGMPAWPTQQRDDEVWAMVAFLQKFPDMNEDEYHRMAIAKDIQHSENSTPQGMTPLQVLTETNIGARSLIESCDRCHGIDGHGRQAGLAPKLAGQESAYIRTSLEAYARGDRFSGFMAPIAVSLSSADIDAIALAYAKMGAAETTQTLSASQTAILRGATIVQHGVPNSRVPICAECHGPTDSTRNPAYPILAGQYAEYLVRQLELFAKENRGGSKFASLMHPVARSLTSDQMRDVAVYYESLGNSDIAPTR